MPGEVISILVAEGEKVEKGQTLMIISAMKMEMTVTAPLTGTVKKLHVEVGEKLLGDDLMVDIE